MFMQIYIFYELNKKRKIQIEIRFILKYYH